MKIQMKLKQTGCALLTALLIPAQALTAAAAETPGASTVTHAVADAAQNTDAVAADDTQPGGPQRNASDTVTGEGTNAAPDGAGNDKPSGSTADGENRDGLSDETAKPASPEADVPPEPPAFSAHVEWTGGNGYVVRGTFTEFTSDMVKVQPMYSLDGSIYQLCPDIICWDLSLTGTEDPGQLQMLQNQICLVSNMEPLKSYLAGALDRFYVKLCITKENGESYETQAAVIDRGSPQPLPDGITATPRFDASMRVRTSGRPFRYYGKYQITVSADAAPGEIAACLPDTVPVEICLTDSNWNAYTEGVIDCPVTWKPLTLPQLTPGGSVTISDVAEEITIPAGTLLDTPIGIFRLDEPFGFDDLNCRDDIDLVLNVVSADAAPTGTLSAERDGLELAFDLKPTGATAIQVYTCVEGDKQWTKQPVLLSPDALSGQYSTANSGYALVLDNDTEPYRSYLSQKESGNPAPFFIGVKIEGGVYDGKELILAWPDSYDLPLSLPKLGGSGGNENNAGSDGKGDGTDEGQRPTLPENPSASSDGQSSGSASGAQDRPEAPDVPEPGQSDLQPPDVPEPGWSDSQSPDHPKPVRPSEQKPDRDASQDDDKNAGTDPENSGALTEADKTDSEKDSGTDPEKNAVSDAKAGTVKNAVTDGKTHTSKNYAADDPASAPKDPSADQDTPSAQTPAVKKAGASDTPASPGLLPDDALHMNGSKDLQTAQASETGDMLPNRQEHTKTPERNENNSRPLLPVAAAAALFGICIFRAKKFSGK